jgi:hypothetical protein
MDTKVYKEKHQVCPKEWKEVPVITGDFEMDAVIANSHNADVPARLKLYAQGNYGQVTAYGGYHNYSGDS